MAKKSFLEDLKSGVRAQNADGAVVYFDEKSDQLIKREPNGEENAWLPSDSEASGAGYSPIKDEG